MSRTPPLPSLDYPRLFSDPRMFDSRKAFVAAGFKVKQVRDESIMVGEHPSVPSYLFKKFSHNVDRDEQRDNYHTRVKGANAIRSMIERYRLDRLVVPHKWIYELTSSFSKRRRSAELLIVERMNLLDMDETVRRYRSIDRTTLEQLCRVLHEFSGFDSAIHNLRFTTAGQIAFFDTESWDRSPRSPVIRVFRRLAEEFTKDSKKIVKQLFDRLDDE